MPHKLKAIGKDPKEAVDAFTQRQIERIVGFEEDEPFDVLGPHLRQAERRLLINAFLPRAEEAWIVFPKEEGRAEPLKKIHPAGFFQAVRDGVTEIPFYKIRQRDAAGYANEAEDPYAYATAIGDLDLYLIGEGSHYKSYEKFGARMLTLDGVKGVHFAVWAPNARSVSIVGNFNHWRVGAHPMARVHFSGVWGLFVPGLSEGEVYKFALKSSADGGVRMKTDPYALASELRPRTASVTTSLYTYQWGDEKWLRERAAKNPLEEPLSIYEVHLGSWRRRGEKGEAFLDYKELARELVDYVKEMGYTHIELMPVMEHPLDESWGYQVVNYFAPTSRFGTPHEFMHLVDLCHQNGIGVILDWVPAHFPKDAYGLSDFDGKQLYAYESWKKAEHRDWGTLVFDYGKNEVRNFLISNALFWIEKYHVDGLRVDAVASMLYLDYSRKEGEWEPNRFGGRENLEAVDFMKKFNEVVHGTHPGVFTVAEESTAWPGVSRPTYAGGLGFSLKWNMGWMHDTLEYFSKDPVHRRHHQGMLTFSMLYAFTENFVLPISHDEVVHGKGSLLSKMPGDDWQKFANTRLFLGWMYGHPGKKLLFMTNDIGQRKEWDDAHSMDWHLMNYDRHRQLNLYVKDLNRLYRGERALYEVNFDPAGFEWVDFTDTEASVFSFLRWSRGRDEALLFVYNMTPVPRHGYRVGVPWPGFYEEILNSDAAEYGGSGIGNFGGTETEPVAWHGRPYAVSLHLPPLAVTVFRHQRTQGTKEGKNG